MGWNDVVQRSRRTTGATATAAGPSYDYGSVGGVQQAQDNQIRQQTGYGDRATNDYLTGAENFDASASLNKYAGGAWSSIQSALGDTLKQQAGAAVGAGRFNSGFYDEDNGTVINRATQQFNDAIAQQSMNAASLQQQNTAGLGQFANQRTEMGNDMLMSRSEQVQNDAREEAERKRRSGSGLWGSVGTGLGYLAGGPVGGTIGGAIGGYLGGR